jgi:hypothetical protein
VSQLNTRSMQVPAPAQQQGHQPSPTEVGAEAWSKVTLMGVIDLLKKDVGRFSRQLLKGGRCDSTHTVRVLQPGSNPRMSATVSQQWE